MDVSFPNDLNVYGSGGGRQIPGSATTLAFRATYDDGRTSNQDTVGGGAGQAGSNNTYLSDGFSEYLKLGGGGGGWGAKGGNTTTGTSTLAGAAAGKAINTNGFAVTWVSGAARAYGPVG